MSYTQPQENQQQPAPDDIPLRHSQNIQGNVLAAFNKDHVVFLFVAFDGTGGRRWVGEMAPLVAETEAVEDFNEAFSAARKANGGQDPDDLHESWIGLGFSVDGLRKLANDDQQLSTDLQGFGVFVAGAKASAGRVGDLGPSDPAKWLFGADAKIDAIVTLAADRPEDLEELEEEIVEINGRHGTSVTFRQTGETLPGAGRGHEHFGFKDGISQPGIKQFHKPDPADPGKRLGHHDQDLIAPGEFVLGYPDQDGTVKAAPAWMHDGSFQVYRRLTQDVPGFWKTVEQQQAKFDDLNQEQLAAKLVGRWRSGASLAHNPTTDPNPGPGDPDDNDFDFKANDPDGKITPLCAHIRKVYPRDSDPPTDVQSEKRRILRRGIPFGAPFDPAGGEGAGVDAKRGLNFVCFQASIEDKFEFLQKFWANSPSFPAQNVGPDPIIGNNDAATPLTFPTADGESHSCTFPRFVTTEASVYAFNPGKSTLIGLAEGQLD